ncbi:MAG: spore germination protein, partial [Desulfotomaculaceae bacterium]
MAFFSRRRKKTGPADVKPNTRNSGQGSKKQIAQNLLLSPDLDENLRLLKQSFADCSDVVFREFLFAQREQIKLALVYVDGLTNKSQLSDQVMRALSLEIPAA